MIRDLLYNHAGTFMQGFFLVESGRALFINPLMRHYPLALNMVLEALQMYKQISYVLHLQLSSAMVAFMSVSL